MSDPLYRRVIVKLSGEALTGPGGFGIDQSTVDRLAGDLVATAKLGVELGVVVGGGNIFRGIEVSKRGVERPVGDTMGMLATVMNCLVLEAAIERQGREARTLSALAMPSVCERPRRALGRGHRQSVFYHRHHGGAARGRTRLRSRAQGYQCRWRLQRRSEKGPEGDAV
jgi:uridylate kinase